DDKLPVIIVKDLSVEEKNALITVLKSHKRAIAWKLFDIKGIHLEFCTHKILMEEDFEPAGRTVVITTEDMKKRRNDVKARTTLLLALPDEHQLRFSKYETAKELWEVKEKTRKRQKQEAWRSLAMSKSNHSQESRKKKKIQVKGPKDANPKRCISFKKIHKD
nr:reverse transcriptase domain-containing protein, chloroplastic [Tanacetum cinerariifolium]